MALSPDQLLQLALDPCQLFAAQGWTPDPWQAELLRSNQQRIMLNCSRSAGKSTTVAAPALHTALFNPRCLVLLLARAARQAAELFRHVMNFYNSLGWPIPPRVNQATKIEFENGSRIIALPGKESNIRSNNNVKLLIIDDAARVTEDLYRSVRPMLAVSNGRLILLSTPWGQRGFFFHEWVNKATNWQRFEVDAAKCPLL